MADLKRQIWARLSLKRYLDVATANESIRKGVRFNGPNVYILACAIVIASVGLNVNSIPVIIGAMLISPLMGPIVGIGLALGTNDSDLLKCGLRNLGIMVFISICASTFYFLLSPLKLENPTELLARTNPTLYDVLIALFGGFAGIIETSRKEKGTVISGVAIATALMPPLCTLGYGIATFNLHYAFGALYLFFINGIFIALATYVGVRYFGFEQVAYSDPATSRRVRKRVSIGLIIILIPSIISAFSMIRQSNFQRSVSSFVESSKVLGGNFIYSHEENFDSRPYTVELFLSSEPDNSDKETLYTLAEEQGIGRGQIIMNTEGSAIRGNKLLHEMYTNNSRQLQAKDSIINALQKELKSYQDNGVPFRQIADEITAQYPSVVEASVTQGYIPAKEGDNNSHRLMIVLHATQSLSAEETAKLTNWLKVRLPDHSCQVEIIQQ